MTRWETTTIFSAGRAKSITARCAGRWFGRARSTMVPGAASSTPEIPPAKEGLWTGFSEVQRGSCSAIMMNKPRWRSHFLEQEVGLALLCQCHTM